MKKLLLSISFLLMVAVTTNAQQMMKRENMKLLKTSYITDALDLTPKEAEKFWPVYNLYTDKIQTSRFSLESGMYSEITSAGGVDAISEKQAQKFIEESLILEQKIADNKIKMIRELSKILPAKKVIKLQKAERDFNLRMLQEYGKRKRLHGQ